MNGQSPARLMTDKERGQIKTHDFKRGTLRARAAIKETWKPTINKVAPTFLKP